MSDLVKPSAEEGAIPDRVESFISRGLGADKAPSCFVCGEALEGFVSNLAAFVKSRESGMRVVAMLNDRAWLDFRPHEPRWIQVKIGVCPDHRKNLQALHDLTSKDSWITDEIIKSAIGLHTGGESRTGGDVTKKV